MSEPKLTAEERAREVLGYPDGPFEDCWDFASIEMLVDALEAHAAAAVAEVTRERDEAIEACSLLRGDYQSVIDRMDALGYPHHPEHQWRDTVSLRLSEMHGQYHNALARVAELEAEVERLREALHAAHRLVGEDRIIDCLCPDCTEHRAALAKARGGVTP